MIKLIAFDLDNVLIDGEVIDEMAKLTGVEEEISKITSQAMEGEIDFGTALKERVSLLKGASVEDVNKVMLEIPLMEGAKESVKELKKRGYKIATITGSFDCIAQRMKDELDLDYVYFNTLQEEDGVLTGEVSGPLVEGTKREILQDIMKMEKLSPEETAAVGDGANDVSMLEEAGLGIAFNAKPVLKEIADVVIDKKDLRELLEIFDGDSSNASEKAEEEAKESFTELLSQKKDLEKTLKELTAKRDKLNDEAKAYRKERDELNAQIRGNLDKALKYRDERDQINQEVKKYKKLRDEAHQAYKKMEWTSGRREAVQVEDEIKRLEKTIETRVLDIRKENELVKKVTDLRKKLQGMQEDEESRSEALKLKEESESYHAKVVELSDQAQETHEKMLEYFRKIDEIRSQADAAHQKFIETRESANKVHDEVKATFGKIRKANKGMDKVKAKERSIEDEIVRKKNSVEKEKAEEIYRKFLEGKKVSTEELLLLQKHKIV
ncbi:MAG: phosphoserine phosphatase [Methanobacterium sp.]|uniref:phosphoserine phosphatase SerB n=1 Tax=Methanobacterium sp. TaxID=2164 RepID=UPI0003C96FD1|nr:phosphoserine phosphatase SerB [Methanobacterium sp.]MDI3550204.1 phosphoserine phosphatase [Methanobacterium sp.]CDG64405.1 phosphoserine phosphatase SerB [Methanobacterium sp. MB1]